MQREEEMPNQLTRYIHKDGAFRAVVVDTTKMGQDAFKQHMPSPLAIYLLTHAMTGALLLSSDIKGDATLQLKMVGDGPAGHLTVEANTLGQTRGFLGNLHVPFDSQNGRGLLEQAIGAGNLHIKRLGGENSQPYTSLTPLVKGEIAYNLAHYLLKSQQIQSAIQTGVGLDPNVGVKSAGGVLIQAMPNADENLLYILEDRLQQMAPISMLFSKPDGKEKVLDWLFGDFPVKELNSTGVCYCCNCDFPGMLAVIASLPLQELQNLRQDDQSLSIQCSYCANTFVCNSDDLDTIIQRKVQEV